MVLAGFCGWMFCPRVFADEEAIETNGDGVGVEVAGKVREYSLTKKRLRLPNHLYGGHRRIESESIR